MQIFMFLTVGLLTATHTIQSMNTQVVEPSKQQMLEDLSSPANFSRFFTKKCCLVRNDDDVKPYINSVVCTDEQRQRAKTLFGFDCDESISFVTRNVQKNIWIFGFPKKVVVLTRNTTAPFDMEKKVIKIFMIAPLLLPVLIDAQF